MGRPRCRFSPEPACSITRSDREGGGAMKGTGMMKIKDILQHRDDFALPQAQIAAAVGVSTGTVSHALASAEAAGLPWPLPGDLDDEALKRHLYPTHDPDGDRLQSATSPSGVRPYYRGAGAPSITGSSPSKLAVALGHRHHQRRVRIRPQPKYRLRRARLRRARQRARDRDAGRPPRGSGARRVALRCPEPAIERMRRRSSTAWV